MNGANYYGPHFESFSITYFHPYSALRILSNNFNLRSFLNVNDHISQPNITTGNIIDLYISNFNLLERIQKDKKVDDTSYDIAHKVSCQLVDPGPQKEKKNREKNYIYFCCISIFCDKTPLLRSVQ